MIPDVVLSASRKVTMSQFFKSFSPYWLWIVLALPAAGLMSSLAGSDDPSVYEGLLHPTGEFSARFMIIAMLASPLMLIFKGWRGPQWLKKNRRILRCCGLCLCRVAHGVLPS